MGYKGALFHLHLGEYFRDTVSRNFQLKIMDLFYIFACKHLKSEFYEHFGEMQIYTRNKALLYFILINMTDPISHKKRSLDLVNYRSQISISVCIFTYFAEKEGIGEQGQAKLFVFRVNLIKCFSSHLCAWCERPFEDTICDHIHILNIYVQHLHVIFNRPEISSNFWIYFQR
jgi:hypothetical protein